MRDYEDLYKAQQDAEWAKERLINIMYKLEEAGFVRKAKSLGTIIGNLETWQNTR